MTQVICLKRFSYKTFPSSTSHPTPPSPTQKRLSWASASNSFQQSSPQKPHSHVHGTQQQINTFAGLNSNCITILNRITHLLHPLPPHQTPAILHHKFIQSMCANHRCGLHQMRPRYRHSFSSKHTGNQSANDSTASSQGITCHNTQHMSSSTTHCSNYAIKKIWSYVQQTKISALASWRKRLTSHFAQHISTIQIHTEK